MTVAGENPVQDAVEALMWLETTRQGLPAGWSFSVYCQGATINAALEGDWIDPDESNGFYPNLLDLHPEPQTFVEAVRRLRQAWETVTLDELLARQAWCENAERGFSLSDYEDDTLGGDDDD